MNNVRNLCQVAVYVEGSAREGTVANIADPANIMGGARYRACGKESYTKDSRGHWLCEEHAREKKDLKKRLDKQQRSV